MIGERLARARVRERARRRRTEKAELFLLMAAEKLFPVAAESLPGAFDRQEAFGRRAAYLAKARRADIENPLAAFDIADTHLPEAFGLEAAFGRRAACIAKACQPEAGSLPEAFGLEAAFVRRAASLE